MMREPFTPRWCFKILNTAVKIIHIQMNCRVSFTNKSLSEILYFPFYCGSEETPLMVFCMGPG